MTEIKSTTPRQKTHTAGPWTVTTSHTYNGVIAYVTADTGHDEIAVLYDDKNQAENARLIACAPDLLEDARENDAAFMWLAEQMNSITDNAHHWGVERIRALAQELRIDIEQHQKRTRAAIARAEGAAVEQQDVPDIAQSGTVRR